MIAEIFFDPNSVCAYAYLGSKLECQQVLMPNGEIIEQMILMDYYDVATTHGIKRVALPNEQGIDMCS